MPKECSVFQCDKEAQEDGLGNVTSMTSESVLSVEELKDHGCELAGEGNMREALDHFERGIKLDPSHYLCWELKSQVLLHFDKFLPAIHAAEEATRLAPDWPEGFVTLARAQREFGEIEMAVENMKKALSLDKTNLEYLAEHNEMTIDMKKLQKIREEQETQDKQACCNIQGQCSCSAKPVCLADVSNKTMSD